MTEFEKALKDRKVALEAESADLRAQISMAQSRLATITATLAGIDQLLLLESPSMSSRAGGLSVGAAWRDSPRVGGIAQKPGVNVRASGVGVASVAAKKGLGLPPTSMASAENLKTLVQARQHAIESMTDANERSPVDDLATLLRKIITVGRPYSLDELVEITQQMGFDFKGKPPRLQIRGTLLGMGRAKGGTVYYEENGLWRYSGKDVRE